MPLAEKKSRYRKAERYRVTEGPADAGRVVLAPPRIEETLLGFHRRRQGQRLDHLANRYLDDPAGFWRICELNDVMLPEALSERDDVAIPRRRR